MHGMSLCRNTCYVYLQGVILVFKGQLIIVSIYECCVVCLSQIIKTLSLASGNLKQEVIRQDEPIILLGTHYTSAGPKSGETKKNQKKNPHKCENDLEYANSGILNYHTYPMFTFSQKTNICNGNNISGIFKMHLRPKLHASQFHSVSIQWHFPWHSSILRFRSWLQVEHRTAVRTWC